MFLDAPQRQAVRDLLGLASTFDDGVTILPKLHCHIDRYWGFLSRGRIPLGLQSMPLPFGCPQERAERSHRLAAWTRLVAA